MCKMILSINPEYVERILDGSKEYEFRKIRCRGDVDGIIIYATAPVKKVVAEATIEYVLEDKPAKIWEKTKMRSGISRRFFFQYFKGKTKAVAYKLGDISVFDEPKQLESFGVTAPPQSFVYVYTR